MRLLELYNLNETEVGDPCPTGCGGRVTYSGFTKAECDNPKCKRFGGTAMKQQPSFKTTGRLTYREFERDDLTAALEFEHMWSDVSTEEAKMGGSFDSDIYNEMMDDLEEDIGFTPVMGEKGHWIAEHPKSGRKYEWDAYGDGPDADWKELD